MNSDASLEQAIIDELVADDNLKMSTIGVSVKDGIVHLVGKVHTKADLDEARAQVRAIKGVRKIVTRMRVTPEFP